MKIVLRAFNKDRYHKDILIASERQVLQADARISDPSGSIHSGLIGYGGCIYPRDFPEMDRFELVIVKDE